jgi:hypothetical protein
LQSVLFGVANVLSRLIAGEAGRYVAVI